MSGSQTVVVVTDAGLHALRLEGRHAEPAGSCFRATELPRSLCGEFDVDRIAEEIVQTVSEASPGAESVILVLPLSWCFSQVMDTSADKGEALAFAFESHLPLPLEELTCAFVPLTTGHTLALAVPTEPTRRLLSAIESRRIEVTSLLVDVALLASQTQRPRSTGFLILDERSVRFVFLGSADDPPQAGFWGMTQDAGHDTSIDQSLAQRRLQGFNEWAVLCVSRPESVDAMDRLLDGTEWKEREIGADAVVRIARSACSASIAADLRSGALIAAGHWNEPWRIARHAILLAAACLVIAFVGFRARHQATMTEIERVQTAQTTTYRELFGRQVPAQGAPMRLASERIRLEALTRKQSTSPDRRPAPLRILREFAASVPADVRLTLHEARVDEKQLTLRGLTTEHRDAERITESLHRLAGLEVRPPRTRRLDSGGVEFSITAQLGGASKP